MSMAVCVYAKKVKEKHALRLPKLCFRWLVPLKVIRREGGGGGSQPGC